MAVNESTVIKLACDRCAGGVRNHFVVAEHIETINDDEVEICEVSTYQICRCQGCDTYRFRREDEINGQFVGETVFPQPRRHGRREISELKWLPGVGRVYSETIAAFDVGASILTGAGLRAIVEAICADQGAAGTNLQARIDSLVEKGLLAKPQAELLHEERYIGNSALHETEPPSDQHLAYGLDIIEGLLNAIYVLPRRADELRAARLAEDEQKS